MNRSFENTQTPNSIQNNEDMSSNIFSGKNLMIIILTGLLILSFLGINLLMIFGNWIQVLINIFGPLVTQILSIFGYTTGTVLDKTEDVATSVAKSGIDIAGGAIQSVADLLKDISSSNVDPSARSQLDQALDQKKTADTPLFKRKEPEADSSDTSIQKPITSEKLNWCLVGEYQGKRGCVEVDDANKCMSGQVFPTQQMCLNPTKTVFMHSHAS
jgi:hypothetical protein|uniref:Uncharacterized protein n=1 Tax=viral metagenome TaxID=1070528 RepID=A0A6C0IPT8_9ZZZZ